MKPTELQLPKNMLVQQLQVSDQEKVALKRLMDNAINRIKKDEELNKKVTKDPLGAAREVTSTLSQSDYKALYSSLLKSELQHISDERIGNTYIVVAARLWKELGSLDPNKKGYIISEMFLKTAEKSVDTEMQRKTQEIPSMVLAQKGPRQNIPPAEKMQQKPTRNEQPKETQPKEPEMQEEEKQKSPVLELLAYFESISKNKPSMTARETESGIGISRQKNKVQEQKEMEEEKTKKAELQAFVNNVFDTTRTLEARGTEPTIGIARVEKKRIEKILSEEGGTKRVEVTAPSYRQEEMTEKREEEHGVGIKRSEKVKEQKTMEDEERVSPSSEKVSVPSQDKTDYTERDRLRGIKLERKQRKDRK